MKIKRKVGIKKGYLRTGWTEERKAKQAAMIKNWQPWKKSTGPKTQDGKDKAKMNAYKHGMRGAEMKSVIVAMQYQRDFVRYINDLSRAGEAKLNNKVNGSKVISSLMEAINNIEKINQRSKRVFKL